MVSNRLTHRRTTISNPKICKSKLKPLRPLPPEPPPQWPPPYINARITALVNGQQFEATLTLEPRGVPPGRITYDAHDTTIELRAAVILYADETPNRIRFNEIYNYRPYFDVGYGPTVDVQPPTFTLRNSQWFFKDPYHATVEMAIAYPDEP